MAVVNSKKSDGTKAGAKSAGRPRKSAASGLKLPGTAKTVRAKMAVKTAKEAAPTKRKAAAKVSRSRNLAAVVKRGLPGYMLVERPLEKADKMEDGFVRIDQGPSLADLKRKFFGDDQADSAGDAFDSDDGRISVRVRPEHGGDAKTADIGRDGRITIVQG